MFKDDPVDPTRRAVIAALPAAVVVTAGGRIVRAQPAAPRVRIETALGAFVVEVYPDRAPLSAGNFLDYVDRGLLDGQSVYRIVSLDNQPDTVPAKIEVIQFGWRGEADAPPPLPPIAHETTEDTGLRHLDGTVSTARFEPGTGGPAFFICVGDQPALDYGGRRNPDGQGFAAFGQVVEGMDVVRRIHGRAEASDMLETPIPIVQARRLEA